MLYQIVTAVLLLAFYGCYFGKMLLQLGQEQMRQRSRSMAELPQRDCPTDLDEGVGCRAGSTSLWLTWDGRMLPCGMLTEPKENLWEKGFSDSWESIKEQVAKIRLCSDCRECREKGTCSSCAAVLQAETKDFTKKPEYMCEVNRAYRKSLRELGGKAHEKE